MGHASAASAASAHPVIGVPRPRHRVSKGHRASLPVWPAGPEPPPPPARFLIRALPRQVARVSMRKSCSQKRRTHFLASRVGGCRGSRAGRGARELERSGGGDSPHQLIEPERPRPRRRQRRGRCPSPLESTRLRDVQRPATPLRPGLKVRGEGEGPRPGMAPAWHRHGLGVPGESAAQALNMDVAWQKPGLLWGG